MTEGRRGDLEFGTIPRLVRTAAERHGEAAAIVDGEVTLSFRQLEAAAERAAEGLLALGVEAGDRVGIWAPNVWEWIVAAIGAHSVGAAIVPINTRFKGGEAAYVLRRARARVLFTVSGFLGMDYVGMLKGEDLPELRRTVVMKTPDWDAFLEGGEAIDPAVARARADAVTGETSSDVIFTSGTTGHPKGVVCTHAQSLRAFRDWAHVIGLRAGDRYLIVNPFFHTFGYKAGWLAAFMLGATVYPQPVFDANAVLERIGRDRISVLPGPPTLYQTMLARPDLKSYDLSSLRLAVTGAAVIPVELVERMRQELQFDTVITGYGLTEASGVSTMCRVGDDPETIATTSGRAIPDVDVKIVDDDGKEVARGAAGEVVVKGYTVTTGYLDDPEETARSIVDGWLHTGDVGVMDARGYLKITDRKKDMFIVGGFNAYPAEIERVLLTHDAIAQAAVVGAPDERLGEVGVAYVVVRPGASLQPEALIAWSRERLANYKVPRRVEILDALPLNATGKVLKYQLRERARS